MVSVARGSKDLKMCGTFRKTARYALLLSFIVIIPVFLLSHKILEFLNYEAVQQENSMTIDSKEVVHFAYHYIVS
jgi:Na+-driven multidrug efflux pump